MANQFSYQSNRPNDQLMYTSNRSRSESGSSDSSRGSGNSGNSGNGGKTRRRSHRPRGCRGGSNRRKQKNADGGNKPFFKKTYNSDFKNRVHGKFSNSAMNQIHRAGSSEAEIVVNNNKKQCVPDSFLQGAYNNNFSKDHNQILPEYANYHPSEMQYGGSMIHNRNTQLYYSNPASKYISEPEHDYPLLQSTFSESSTETFCEQRDAYVLRSNDDGILPPLLPSEEYLDPPKHIPSGPNPYALKSSINHYQTCNHGSNKSNASYVTHSSLASTPAQAIVRPVTRPQPCLVDNTVPVTSCLPGILQQVHTNIDWDYRSHRLEKQRQTVVGGSLFVTSPRSFLMGCKRSFHE